MFARILLMLAVAVALVPARADSTVQAKPERFDLTRPEIKTFIDEVAKRNSLNRRDLSKLLAKAEPQPKIIELITKPAERVSPWWEYRARFMTEERIALGTQLWQEHREDLERIAAERGVPAEYIVAIIGVETKYGRITGRYRVLDALATLAFDYPPRSEFFRKELEQFVLLTREEQLDPLKTLGSYAGAMGNAQFMPSSYRKFAVDAQDDKKRDLWDWDDVFASIANYFREHGWETGGPVMADVDLDPEPTFVIDTRNLQLNETLSSLAAQGVETRTNAPASTPAMLISAEQSDGPAYRVGFNNFQVITKYNRSSRYAMAVHDLALAVAERVRAMPAVAAESKPAVNSGVSAPPREATLSAGAATEAPSSATPPAAATEAPSSAAPPAAATEAPSSAAPPAAATEAPSSAAPPAAATEAPSSAAPPTSPEATVSPPAEPASAPQTAPAPEAKP